MPTKLFKQATGNLNSCCTIEIVNISLSKTLSELFFEVTFFRYSIAGPISFPPATVINTDDESSMASTPSPHTPFSNTKVFENGTAGRGASGSMDRGSPASSLASYLPGPLSPAESPPAVELPSKQPEVGHTSPFISELVNKGVRYIEYSSLKVCSELGSVSLDTVF